MFENLTALSDRSVSFLTRPLGASQAEKAYPPNFTETTEIRRINLFRRISVSSASFGEKFFAF
jgi:hypothetical protein